MTHFELVLERLLSFRNPKKIRKNYCFKNAPQFKKILHPPNIAYECIEFKINVESTKRSTSVGLVRVHNPIDYTFTLKID